MEFNEYYKANEEWFDAYGTSKTIGEIIWNDAQAEAIKKIEKMFKLS